MCFCVNGAISSHRAVSQYVGDVSRTPVGSGAIQPVPCGCLSEEAPCCVNHSCTTNSCPIPTGVQDAGPIPDAEEPQGRTVMCGLNIGTFDAGTDAGGPWRWCQVGENCVPFNGGWACCMIQPSGGFAVCAAPIAGSAGN